MTKIICDFTSCVNNSSCCCAPKEDQEHYCTADKMKLGLDEDHMVKCYNYEEDYEKPIECKKCQIKRYGALPIEKPIEFTIVKSDDAPF